MVKLLTTGELRHRLRVSATAFKTIKALPGFPKPVLLTPTSRPKWRESEIAEWLAPRQSEPHSHAFIGHRRAESFRRFLGDDFVSDEMSIVRLNDEREDSAVEVFIVRYHRREALDEFWAHCREGGK